MSKIPRRSLIIVLLLTAVIASFVAVPVQSLASYSPPPPAACSGFYIRVMPGDTLSRIASRYGVSVSRLASCNGLANINRIFVGQLLLIPRGGGGYPPPPMPGPVYHHRYLVRPGDYVNRIARMYGVSSWSIISANHLHWPYTIYVGQWLYIP